MSTCDRQKLQLIRYQVIASGIINIYEVLDNQVLRIVTEQADAGNIIIVEARIKGATNWTLLQTITANDDVEFGISTFDELRVTCTVFASTATPASVLLSISGFLLSSDNYVTINDSSTNLTQTWSSTKIRTEIDVIGDKNVRSTRFSSIGSGTSGTVTIPAEQTVVLDDFGGTTDAVVTTISGGRPTFEAARTAGGTIIATTFDASGNYTFTGTPSSYPVAIIYRVKQKISTFNASDSSLVGEFATRLTEEETQDAVGSILADTTTIDLTYNDATPSITADVVNDSLTNAKISPSAAIAYSKLALSNSIVNADINTSAAIARTKLASGTPSTIVVNNGSGVMADLAVLTEVNGGTNQSTYATGDTLYASAANTLSKLTIGTQRQIKEVSSAGILEYRDWFNPKNRNVLFEDFQSDATSFASGITTTGSTAGFNSNGGLQTSSECGVYEIQTGTSTASGSTYTGWSNNNGWVFGNGQAYGLMKIRFSRLSTTAQHYRFRAGWYDDTSQTDSTTDGVYFYYDSDATGDFWVIKTANNSTRTATTTATAITATTWMRLSIIVNTSGTLATFYVNDVSIGTIATNIPTGTGRAAGFRYGIHKTAGTGTESTVAIDYLFVDKWFDTPR